MADKHWHVELHTISTESDIENFRLSLYEHEHDGKIYELYGVYPIRDGVLLCLHKEK